MTLPLSAPLLDSALELPLVRKGKVRDVYAVGDQHLLIVATDRISAFDYVLGSGIPDKGRILTAMSLFWFARVEGLVRHHLVSTELADFPVEARRDDLVGRTMLVHRSEPFPVECVARGYLSGSGWKDYQQSGTVCGIPLPAGLRESDRLPSPIFTPATKAASGHDENISEADASRAIGADRVARLRELTLAIYARASAHAAQCGIILADTKFEFGGLRTAGAGAEEIILIDEILTPDSSRFWPADTYAPGGPQASFDKQFVRDHLEAIRWDKRPPVPALPDDVIVRTRAKYLEALQRLTGRGLS
ncbi:MAG: phosphoribosylaminoimidazolesuccinocarboxamide synthase [Acidobacteria bacterium]|nr:phosphoribosylaminoimidazolesuccinocarboxamide synthase [Acidobacteriota bacterium]